MLLRHLGCKYSRYFFFLSLLVPCFAVGQVGVADVGKVESSLDVDAYTRYARVASTDAFNLEQPALPSLDSFKTLPNEEISFGYTADAFWFLLETLNNSNETTELLLDTNVKFMEPIVIYELLNDQTLVELLRVDESTPFNTRPVSTPKLTLPLVWQENQRRQFLIYVESGSGVDMSLQLSTLEEITEKYSNNRTFFALLTGILSTLILINLFHYYAVRRLAHLLYAGQELAILFFMLHIDGLAFQYVWPDSPSWNSHATMVFGHLVNFMALLFTVSFLELKTRAPIFFKVLSSAASVSLVMLLLTPFIEPEYSDRVGLFMAAFGAVLIFTAGIVIASRGYRPARYFVAGWLFMATGTVVYGLVNLAFISLPFAPLILLRFGVLVEALLLSYGLSDQLKTLSDTARQVQKDLLESTEKRLREVQENVRLEQERDDAARILFEKDLDIARAKHDIRQPIYSLRLALLASKPNKVDSASHEVINRSLDHMEQLLLEETGNSEGSPNPNAFKTYGALFDQLYSEFSDEAESHGIRLCIHSSSKDMTVPQVPLKRVISNLLANALRHSNGTKLVVGLKRKSAGDEIIVVDNGVGISDNESKNAGEGLGMGIVRALCEEHGWSFHCISKPGQGTCVRIGLSH
ncbi:MAG: sensor histidine kinase [Pseudohongiellaceae bacterium]